MSSSVYIAQLDRPRCKPDSERILINVTTCHKTWAFKLNKVLNRLVILPAYPSYCIIYLPDFFHIYAEVFGESLLFE